MIEISEALQHLIDRTANQVVQEAQAYQAETALKIEGDFFGRNDVTAAAPWAITWDTKGKG